MAQPLGTHLPPRDDPHDVVVFVDDVDELAAQVGNRASLRTRL